jgi:hypothetical protein
MSVQEIETAVTRLSADELSRFSQWFEEYVADQWDRQIEADILAGRFDAAVSLSEKSDWDIAAAHLLVLEAGGKVTNAAGEEIRYDTLGARHPSVIAAAPGIFAPLMALRQRG